LLNVLRRPGTPVTVLNAKTGASREEGRDFGRIVDERLNFRFDHEPPKIKILPSSRIQDGDRLKVSYYHGMGVNQGPVSALRRRVVAEFVQVHVAQLEAQPQPGLGIGRRRVARVCFGFGLAPEPGRGQKTDGALGETQQFEIIKINDMLYQFIVSKGKRSSDDDRDARI
jgi:hypothetical protein